MNIEAGAAALGMVPLVQGWQDGVSQAGLKEVKLHSSHIAPLADRRCPRNWAQSRWVLHPQSTGSALLPCTRSSPDALRANAGLVLLL